MKLARRGRAIDRRALYLDARAGAGSRRLLARVYLGCCSGSRRVAVKSLIVSIRTRDGPNPGCVSRPCGFAELYTLHSLSLKKRTLPIA